MGQALSLRYSGSKWTLHESGIPCQLPRLLSMAVDLPQFHRKAMVSRADDMWWMKRKVFGCIPSVFHLWIGYYTTSMPNRVLCYFLSNMIIGKLVFSKVGLILFSLKNFAILSASLTPTYFFFFFLISPFKLLCVKNCVWCWGRFKGE